MALRRGGTAVRAWIAAGACVVLVAVVVVLTQEGRSGSSAGPARGHLRRRLVDRRDRERERAALRGARRRAGGLDEPRPGHQRHRLPAGRAGPELRGADRTGGRDRPRRRGRAGQPERRPQRAGGARAGRPGHVVGPAGRGRSGHGRPRDRRLAHAWDRSGDHREPERRDRERGGDGGGPVRRSGGGDWNDPADPTIWADPIPPTTPVTGSSRGRPSGAERPGRCPERTR